MKLKSKVTSSAIPNEKEDSTKNEQRQTLEERGGSERAGEACCRPLHPKARKILGFNSETLRRE
jgi:hypothetical protein